MVDEGFAGADILKALSTSGSESVVALALDGSIRFTAGQAMTAAAEMIGRDWIATWPAAARGQAAAAVNRAVATGSARFQARSHGRVWDIVVSRNDGEEGQATTLTALGRDVTELVGESAALMEGEARNRRVIENSTDIIVHADLKGVLRYVSPSCRVFGYKPEELVGRPVDQHIHPDDLARFIGNTAEILSGAPIDRSVDRSHRFRRKGGGWVWLEGNPQLVRDENGKPAEVLNVFRDVTDRKQAEIAASVAELSRRASEARTRNMIANVHQAIVTMDQAGLVTAWNRHAEATFGWTTAEAMSRPVADLILPEADRAAHRLGLAKFLETGESQIIDKRIEIPAQRKDGAIFPVEMVISAVRAPMGWEFTGLMHDISARRAQEELFENAFHYAPIGMALVGLDGQFLKVNEAFCGIVGYDAPSLLSLDFQAITHAEDLDKDLALLNQLVARQITDYQMDKRYLRADGQQVWVRLSVSLAAGEDGGPKYFISQVQDLTTAREAEAALRDSEARFRLIAESSTDMIVTTDWQGRVTFITASCHAITGWTAQEMMGQRPADHTHPDDMPVVDRVFRRVAAGGPSERVRWRARHRTEDRWIWLESNPALLGAEMGMDRGLFVDVIRDVTAQVAQEVALEQATAAAEAAAAVKSEFLANMSHEIRTPLTAVLGFTGLLAERADLDGAARSQVERVASAGEALLSIVNDILDFSKLEAGQYEIHTRSVSPLRAAQDALGLFQVQAQARGLALEFVADGDLPDAVAMDPERFRQILLNLIGNAVKFTEKGAVRLTIRHDAAAALLHACVEDTGAGMTEAQQRALFQRFSQVDASSTRRHGGTGLGLAICKGLAEAMGGEIGVRSEPGRGSAFFFSIAAPEAEAEAVAPQAAPQTLTLEGLRVLVVDDNRLNRELARAILENLGADFTDAEDGLAGLEAAQSAAFDVILLDIRMPGLDGPATLKRLREETGPNQHIPVLAFSADAELERFSDQGFDAVIRKPIEAMALVTTIIEALVAYEEKASQAA